MNAADEEEVTGADGAPAAAADGEAPPQQVVVSFAILGKVTSTKPMARAATLDFEGSSVDVVVPRSVALRDELLVHGISFEVHALVPADDDAAAAEAAAAAEGTPDGEGSAADLVREVERLTLDADEACHAMQQEHMEMPSFE